MDKKQIINLLKEDVVPALGCTEPVCVAFCAANAGKILDDEILSVDVEVNSGIYKNGMSAGIPNCTQVGLDYAAAIGIFLKNTDKKLEILKDITEEIIEKAENLIKNNLVNIRLNEQENGLYVKCVVKTKTEKSSCIIRDAHTNIVLIEKDDKVLFESISDKNKSGENDVITELKNMKITDIRRIVDTISEDEIEFLLDGVEMNEKLASYSEKIKTGVGIGDVFRKEVGKSLIAKDLIGKIILKVSSAAESRLDGCSFPTMSSSGAGTKGIVVIIPVSEAADVIGVSKEKKLKALAFAHLINRYINAHIGKLSPMCSCVMASSTAVSAGIAYLLGGNDEQIGYAIRNMSGTVTGMICDGGKVGCALKVSTGSVAAVMSAITAVNGAALRVSDGICAESPEECIHNMAKIGKDGMPQMDKTIIDIMVSKK